MEKTLSISLYDASIPGNLRMLRNLLGLMDKAEAHAAETGKPLSDYVEARLAPDMGNFARQIQFASDGAKSMAARLAGVEVPSYADTETTFPELRERLEKTIAFVESVDRAAVDAGEERVIELKFPQVTMTFTGRNFLFQFSLPNFLFHVTTAYGLLRAQGVPLGKADYLAGA